MTLQTLQGFVMLSQSLKSMWKSFMGDLELCANFHFQGDFCLSFYAYTLCVKIQLCIISVCFSISLDYFMLLSFFFFSPPSLSSPHQHPLFANICLFSLWVSSSHISWVSGKYICCKLFCWFFCFYYLFWKWQTMTLPTSAPAFSVT